MTRLWHEEDMASFTKDFELDIARAQNGLLPPKWQAECFHSLEQKFKQKALTADQYNDMRDRLTKAIASVQQISDLENAKRDATLDGGNLLYYYECSEVNTLMEIIQYKDGFSVQAYIDGAAADDLEQYAANMCEDLLGWAKRIGGALPSLDPAAPTDLNGTVFYATLSDAIEHLLLLLKQPEQLLC